MAQAAATPAASIKTAADKEKANAGRCIVCISAEQTAQNALSVLFEAFEKGTADVIEAYHRSDGLLHRKLSFFEFFVSSLNSNVM